jgi:hypothetical protein
MVKDEEKIAVGEDLTSSPEVAPLENLNKSRWERSWPTIACGAGLFSDGYLNGVRRPRISALASN